MTAAAIDSNKENQKPRAEPTSKSSKPTSRRKENLEKISTKAMNSEILMPATEWPALLYNIDAYNPKDPEHGLSSKAIFFGASFAFNGKIQPKSRPPLRSLPVTLGTTTTIISATQNSTWKMCITSKMTLKRKELYICWRVGTEQYSVILKGSKIAPSSKKHTSLEIAQRLLLQLH
ncbi:hypothetical protein BDP27DRAFT_1405920 [Rhodocollybia butyracea]|uniref:Uncharacterized protein n=1 Tax=Rhodocollybia butyracea TaxID=206335 RepID=A0A9P5PHB7_9AGAR|nr:hypothetical protein BDP27DRAFT_1405920 [Rhodocollybia butyracea]